MNKKELNKLKKEDLIDLTEKHYELNQQFGIFIIELLIKFAKTNEFVEFYQENKDMVDKINNHLIDLELKRE